MLPSKFGVNWPFGSGEEAKNRFSRWLPWQPSWISDQNDFSYFWSTSHPNASCHVWSQLAFGFRRSQCQRQKMIPMSLLLAKAVTTKNNVNLIPSLGTSHEYPHFHREIIKIFTSYKLLSWFVFVDLEFNCPVNTIRVMSSLSVYLATLFLGRLSLLGHYLFVLRFYDPVNPMGSCRARSVYLTTHLLERLSPLSG